MIAKVSHITQMLLSVGVGKNSNFSEITQGHPTSKQFNRIFVCFDLSLFTCKTGTNI